jgi:hypothetical protein
LCYRVHGDFGGWFQHSEEISYSLPSISFC